MGVVGGMALGSNVVNAKLGGVSVASATIINHPNGGPLFSGPQVQPWVFQAGALDAQCNQPTEHTLRYKSTDPTLTGLQAYDPASPPTDLANTTTDKGETLLFIVQQERGYQDRDEYKNLASFNAMWGGPVPPVGVAPGWTSPAFAPAP